MATFEAQVEGLTSISIDGSSAPTQTELTQFLTDGAKEIINVLPPNLVDLCSSSQSFTSGTADTLNTGKVLRVFRSDGDIKQPCRKVDAMQKGRFSDSEDMNYATVTDPVYYIENNSLDVLPVGGSATYSEVQYPSVAYGDSAISVFPDEAEYLVPLYAAVKSLQNAMGNKTSDLPTDLSITAVPPDVPTITASTVSFSTTAPSYASPTTTISGTGWSTAYPDEYTALNTALGAMTTELNKVDNILSTAEGKVDDYYTSIGDIDDTTQLWDDTNKRFAVVKNALDYAGNLIDGNKPHADYDVAQNLLDVNAALDGMQAHLADGETILTNDPTSGDIATALTAMKNAIEAAEASLDTMEASASSVFGDSDTFTAASSQLTRVKAAIDNAEDVINSNQPSATTDAYGALAAEDTELVQSALAIASTEIQRAKLHLQEWTSIGDMRVKEINASLSEAQAYGSEIQARLSYASAYQQASAARGQEGQSRMAQANVTLSVAQQELARANAAIAEINILMGSYRLDLEGVGPYLQAATGYISQAQGYVAETNTRMQREEQKYKWYQAQQAKLQADYDRGIQLLAKG